MTLDQILIIATGVIFFLMLCFILYIRHKRVKLEMKYIDDDNDGMNTIEEAEMLIEENQKVLDRRKSRD